MSCWQRSSTVSLLVLKHRSDTPLLLPCPHHRQDPPPPPLTVEEHDVRRVFLAVNPRKVAGPEGVPGKVLRACAHQLSRLLQDFQPLPGPSTHPHQPEICYNNPDIKKVTHNRPK